MLLSGFIVCDVTDIFIFQPLTVTSLPGAVFHPEGFRNKKLNWINKVICENCMLESARLFICFGIFYRLFFLRSSLAGFDWIILRFLVLLLELKKWQLGLTSEKKTKIKNKRQSQYSSTCTTVSNAVENLALSNCVVLNWKSKIRNPVFSDCGTICTLWSTSPNTSCSTDRTDTVEWSMLPCCHSSLLSSDVTTSRCSWCLR